MRCAECMAKREAALAHPCAFGFSLLNIEDSNPFSLIIKKADYKVGFLIIGGGSSLRLTRLHIPCLWELYREIFM